MLEEHFSEAEINLEKLELELSDLSIHILDLMDQIVSCKVNIEQHIKSGCLDLAKARYISGNTHISSLQLPTEDWRGVTAQFKVVIEGYDNKLECIRCENGTNKKKVTEQEEKSLEKEIVKDPLKWFGVLVPQSLRQAKVIFENCLDIVVENVNLQLELHRCLTKFENLKQTLKKFESKR